MTELKVNATSLVRTLNSLHFYFDVHVAVVGNAGGIILAWKIEFVFQCVACSKNHISGLVYSDSLTHPWLLSCVYGPRYSNAEKAFREKFMNIGDRFGGPWLILGDTNFVLSDSERVGSKGRDRFIPFISNFVNSRGLINMPMYGYKLTWDNHRTCNSDHRPLCLLSGGREDKFKRSFKFEEGLTRANMEEAKGYSHCLERFCAGSGQQVNKIKTSILFSKNTSNGIKRSIKEALGLSSPEGNIKYLGLPLFRSRQKDADFNFILDNLTSKLQGWKAKTLTKASPATLINSVGFVVSYWGSETGNHGLHLKAWDKLCLPKSVTGLGFRKTKEINQAFLAKWGWNLLSGSQSLCCKILEAKYLKGKRFLNYTSKDSDSWFWKSCVSAIPILKKGACKVVVNGKDIKVKFIWDLKNKGINADEVFLYASLTVDTIWRTRNEKVTMLLFPCVPPRRLDAWRTPPQGWLKLNCDVKVVLDSMCSAVVAMDYLGRVIWVHTSKLDFADALGGEAATCCLALDVAKHNGVKYIIV
uniref:Uncharacterized protein n=1 Tax=Cannabis sativa TaxID=3483 RepID=A0A803PKC2_CANSA